MSEIQKALTNAMRDIARVGIAKLGKADAGGARYNFRGVDQAMNEMSPILVNNGITVTPRYSELSIQERAKDGGKFTRFVTVKGSFTFSAHDGSSVVAEAYGEAMDSGDKATTKAQSVSFRTVLFQQFVVPIMAMDTEIEESDEEIAAREAQEAREGELRELALYLVDAHQNGKDLDAIRVFYDPATWSKDNPTATEEQKFVWGLLKNESKLRSTLKANSPHLKAA
jgi:hypothetical protein